MTRPPRRQFSPRLRITALILCGTFALTQAAPAWAMRAESGGSTRVTAGLEEALQSSVAGSAIVAVAQAPGVIVARGVSSTVLADVMARLDVVPSSQRNTRGLVLEALAAFRALGVKGSETLDRAAIAAQLDALIERAPDLHCTTCGAQLAHAILSDPFASPERTQPEELQSAVFQETETLNAVLIAISILHAGRVLHLSTLDTHLLPASTAADLRDLLALMETHPAYPEDARHEWSGAAVTQAQLRALLRDGQLVIAHVGGNHFVRVLNITDGGLVEYTDPQQSPVTGLPGPAVGARTAEEFFRWWKGDAQEATTGTVLIGRRPGQSSAVATALPDEALVKVVGCCGINAAFAHFRSVRQVLDALMRLKYRSPDDSGLAVITGNGLRVRKVEGAADALILDLMAEPENALFPEQLAMSDDSAEIRRLITAGKRNRRTVLAAEGLVDWVTPPADPDPGRPLSDLTNDTIDALYTGGLTVGLGVVGGLYAGWVYTLGGSPNEYQALNGGPLQLYDLVSRWDLTPEFIKLFIRHRLVQELRRQQVASAEQAEIVGAFDRLADRALKQALRIPGAPPSEVVTLLDAAEQRRWEAIWQRFLKGRTIQIPPDFNRDPVRHIFRLLDQIVGSFGEHPEWEEAVQAELDRRRPPGQYKNHRKWRELWQLEYKYNMPGHAWGALVDWLKDWLLERKVVSAGIHDAWMSVRWEQETHRGFSEGTVDLPLLLVIPEMVMGHGRWAMTGDPKWWNGHPQVTTTEAIVHNGAIEAVKNTQLKQEHQRRYEMLMQKAAEYRDTHSLDADVDRVVAAMEQRARLNYGRHQDVAETQEIVTDTRTIVRQWRLMRDDFAADRAEGLVGENALVDVTKPGHLNRPGETYEGRPVFDRAAEWNAVVNNLRARGEAHPDPAEVALRVALREMAPGSGIAVNGMTLATPLTEFVASHDRPVDIVVRQHRDASGKVLFEDYMVTSDSAAGIGLFPAFQVLAAARQIAVMEQETLRAIDADRKALAGHRISAAEFAQKVQDKIRQLQQGLDLIVKGTWKDGPGGVGGTWEGGFHVKVYHLKGVEKFAKISRRLNDDGHQVVDVQIGKLNGEPLSDGDAEKMAVPADETVNPALGDRGQYLSFMAKHIAEIPLILLKQALRYFEYGARSADPVAVKMDSVVEPGAVVQQNAQGLATRYARGTRVTQQGINNEVLFKHFGASAGLEEHNRLPNLKRVVLVGVGSSWRDAKITESLFQELLPGVEILVYDPVEIQNRGIALDPRTDLIVGMSWSGTTDSMVRLFNRLEGDGFVAVAITGKPASDMARIGQFSGGTIDVLSGDESTVATTKGFESVLYSLSLLAVHLSQLQGDPATAAARAEHATGLRRVADLVYDVLAERDRPQGQRLLDLDDPQSLVNRLGRRYAQRQKLLLVGSRNVPIHVEGELKGEEVASIVGLAADIGDASWQATAWANTDPRAPEADKVILGFDMTDESRYDLFMTEIRRLAAAGTDFFVLTSDGMSNPYLEELQFLAAQHPDQIHLVTVPRVVPRLQPLINALFYFRLGAALAAGRGMTAQQIDNSRNLAKSVTVSYAQELLELLQSSTTKVVTMTQQASETARAATAAWLQRHGDFVRRAWASIVDSRQRAIARLPFVLQRAREQFFAAGSWLTSTQDRDQLAQAFGATLNQLRQIIVVTDEESTEYAAQASEDPLGSSEIILARPSEGRLYIPGVGVAVSVKGVYYKVTYDRDAGRYQLAFDPDYPQNQGQPSPATPRVLIEPGAETIEINGYQYRVDSTSFLKDRKKTTDVAFGLLLRAGAPDLLGVKMKVFRASDQALEREMERQDTLFVLVSRSNNFDTANAQIPPIHAGPTEARSASDADRPDLIPHSEAAMVRRAEQLQARGGRFVVLADARSALSLQRHGALGTLALPDDLDDTSVYSVTYLGLLSLGVKLGQARGIQTRAYEEALKTVPGLVAGVLRNTKLRERAQRFIERYKGYRKIHIIGGGQAYADAREFARVLRTLGVFAEAQLNDSAWHGPLAAVDPSREKFADRDRRTGINPSFNTDGDTLVFIMMTDRKFFNTALGGDAQVYDSRNGRFALVIKASDEGLDAVQRVGADEDGIFPLADFPDELGNFANAVAMQYFAAEFAAAQGLARRAAPPAPGLPTPPTVKPAAPLSPADAVTDQVIQRLVGEFERDGDDHLEFVDASQRALTEGPTDQADAVTRVVLVGPYRKIGTLESISGVVSTLLRKEVIHQHAELPKAVRGRGDVGILHFDLKGVSIQEAADRVWDLDKAPRTLSRLILENLQWGPGAPLTSLVPGRPAVPAEIVNHPMAAGVADDANSLAVAFVRAGIVGAVPEPDSQVLQPVADEVDARAAPAIIAHLADVEVAELAAVFGRRFLTRSPSHGLVFRVVDNIKAALSRNGWATELSLDEAGSTAAAVGGPGVVSLGDLSQLPGQKWMIMMTTNVPAEAQAQFAPGGEYALNPLMPASRVESVLGALLKAHGLTAAGRPDWSRLTIVQLAGRPREAVYRQAFETLRSAGAELVTPRDGTLLWGLRANLPLADGGKLMVVWTVSKLDRAIVNLALTKALGGGAWFSGCLLPAAIDKAAQLAKASVERPIGGADEFTALERANTHRWRSAQGDADALLAGKPLTSLDVAGDIEGVAVPITTTAAFGKPILGVVDLEDGVYGLSPIRVTQGHLFVRPDLVYAKPFPEALQFKSALLPPEQAGLEETTVVAPATPASQSGPTTVTRSAAPSAVTISPPVSGTVTLPQTAGVIYGRPEGLAVGLSVALRQGGQAVPSVFVVQNEQEEGILRAHGVADTDILRAWQIEGAFDTATARFEAAVQAARARLRGQSVQVIREITRLPVGRSLAEEFLTAAQELVQSFRIAGVDAQAIADRAQRAAHDLFA